MSPNSLDAVRLVPGPRWVRLLRGKDVSLRLATWELRQESPTAPKSGAIWSVECVYERSMLKRISSLLLPRLGWRWQVVPYSRRTHLATLVQSSLSMPES